MTFSTILKGTVSGKAPNTSTDVYTMVNGKPSNAEIMDQMLEGGTVSPKVTKYLVDSAITMGFTKEQATKFWG